MNNLARVHQKPDDMLSSALRQFCVAALIAAAFSTPAQAAPQTTADAAVAVVAKLYKDFAWQALGSTQDLFGKPLQQQGKTVLRRYFDSGLTALLVQDHACVTQRREVCNMDFDPLFASQDAAATDFTIRPGGAGKVAVAFTYPSSGEKVQLIFQVKQSGKAWRISDIVYPNLRNASLKKTLSTKLPGQ